ncbi:hypothetical protein WR25_06689 [Diploscapter pachys]|uniref:Uncharacterized protein n=1 Tax=Diploscapter pachys TaxID=2018661 RepID=A0A2A2K0V8_9BILA|nr:hypothetical protein WR25_06689 [Diploscapter pachys]
MHNLDCVLRTVSSVNHTKFPFELATILELVGGNSSSSDALPTSLITSFRCRNTLSNISNSIAISLATRRSNGNLTIEAENEASVGCQTREKPDLVTCFWESCWPIPPPILLDYKLTLPFLPEPIIFCFVNSPSFLILYVLSQKINSMMGKSNPAKDGS